MARLSDERIAEIVAEICGEISNLASALVAACPELSERQALDFAIEFLAVNGKVA